VVFALLWLAFGVALVWSQGSIDAAWTWVRSLPLVLQGFAWILFLPVMAGLWIWESGWPTLVRLTLVLGIAGWNLLVFLPRAYSELFGDIARKDRTARDGGRRRGRPARRP